jgi:hypothetical protein
MRPKIDRDGRVTAVNRAGVHGRTIKNCSRGEMVDAHQGSALLRPGRGAMLTILIIILLILLLSGGGYRRYRYGHRGFGDILGLVLVVILILWLVGHVHV